jgi:hypothetical protein
LFDQERINSGEFMLQIMSAALSTERCGRRRPVVARSLDSKRMFLARRRAMLCQSASREGGAISMSNRNKAGFLPAVA